MSTRSNLRPPLLRVLLRSEARSTALAAALMALHEAGEAFVPIIIGATIDRALAPSDGAALAWWLVVLAADFVVLSLSYRFGARRVRRLALDGAHDLRQQVTARTFDRRDHARLPGELLSIATSDAERAAGIRSTVARVAGSVALLVVVTVALLRSSIVLGLVVAIGAPIVLLLLQFTSTRLEQRHADEQEQAAVAAAIATDLVEGLRVLKGMGAEPAALDRYRAASRGSLDATLHAARESAIYGMCSVALTGVFLAVVAGVAGQLAIDGRITVGELIAVMGLALLVLDPLADVATVGSSLARARASATRVAGLVDRPRTEASTGDGAATTTGAATVELRGVAGGGLHDLSIDVGAGELVGVVAEAPGLASALVGCLNGRVGLTAGTVSLDGHDIADLAPDTVRVTMLVAEHDAVLFEGTIDDNIALPGTDPNAVRHAIEASDADEVIASSPEGGATRVTEQGRSLSGGQRQRVALARALARDSPFLVAHDPTSAVDAVTEARIALGLRRVRDGRTTMVVTSSPPLLAACDRVLLIGADGVVASGDHRSLSNREDYRKLVLT